MWLMCDELNVWKRKKTAVNQKIEMIISYINDTH